MGNICLVLHESVQQYRATLQGLPPLSGHSVLRDQHLNTLRRSVCCHVHRTQRSVAILGMCEQV